MVQAARKAWNIRWKLATGVAAAFFCLCVGVLVHDSMGLSESVSESEVREIAFSRPVLYDLVGNPLKITEKDYQRVLMQGRYKAQPGSTIAMVSPLNQVVAVDISQAPLALMRGWNVESLEHAVDRVIHARQQADMWLGDDSDLWFQSALCWMSAILFFGMIVLYREKEAESVL